MKTCTSAVARRRHQRSLLTTIFIFGFFLSNPGIVLFAQKITDPALNFTIFVHEDLKLIGTEVEGRVAVGGNLILQGSTYQIIPKTNDGFTYNGFPLGLAVRGGVVLPNGSDLKVANREYVKIGDDTNPNALIAKYNGGDFRIGYQNGGGGKITLQSNPSDFGSPQVGPTNNPVLENVFGSESGKIDIDGAFQQLAITSTSLSEMTNNVILRDFDNSQYQRAGPFLSKSGLPSKARFMLDPDKINVINISAEVWNSFNNEIRFSGFNSNPAFALIINILGADGTVRFVNMPDVMNNKGRVIFNFPGANGEVILKGNSQIDGVILAPNAKIVKENGANLVGQVIARQFVHNGHEIHFQPLNTSWTQRAITVDATSRCDKDAPYLDYEVHANFNTTGMTAKLEWLAPDGTVVQTLLGQPLKNSILFPGAAVDDNGNGAEWPGWELGPDGKWMQVNDLNSELKKEGATIRVTLNPVFTAAVSYPPSTENCFTNPPPSKTPLPVRLLSFDVTAEQGRIASLTWKVDEAVNFSHFEIEHSTDGRNFLKAGTRNFVETIGVYQFSDQMKGSGLNYYRLKMVDFDQTFVYSPIESIRARPGSEKLSYGYPNPFSQSLQVFSAHTQLARVYNNTGRLIGDIKLINGKNAINTGDWAPGIYLIKTDNQEIIRVIKQ